MNEWAIIFSLVSILLTTITSIFSILAYAKVIGMEKSTHQIQWQPIPESESGPVGKELVDKMKETMYPDIEHEFV